MISHQQTGSWNRSWNRAWMLACALVVVVALAVCPCAAFAQGDLAAGETTQKTSDTTATTPAKKTVKSKFAKVGKIELNRKRCIIKNNKTVQLIATLTPAVEGKKIRKRDKVVTWTVKNPKVARISQTGLVQGKRSGKTKVIAKTRNGKKAVVKIEVKVNEARMATKIPVLTYHRITTNAAKYRYYYPDTLAVSKSMFKEQMKWLKDNGYYTASTTEFRDWHEEGAFLPKKTVLVTIDDGYYETYYVAYPIIRKLGLKATSFVIGHHIGKETLEYAPGRREDHYVGWDVIKKVRKKYPNFEFQSHTYNMHYRASSGNGIATVRSYGSIKEDCAKNAKFGFTALAYPFGHTNTTFGSVLRNDKNIGVAFGYMMTWPATRQSPLYNIPRFKVWGDGSFYDFTSIARTAG